MSAFWEATDCEECLRRQPLAPTVNQIDCVENCPAPLVCTCCNRCGAHCLVKAPNDRAQHDTFWRAKQWPVQRMQ